MLIKIYVSTRVVNSIARQIEFLKGKGLNHKQLAAIRRRLFELYIFIHNEQITQYEKKFPLKEHRYNPFDEFVNLHCSRLRRFRITRNKISFSHQCLLNILIDEDLIEVNSKYSSGKFSKSYRISKSSVDGRYNGVKVNLDLVYHKDIKAREYWVEMYPNHASLITNTYNAKINIDELINWLTINQGVEIKPKPNRNGKMIKRYLTPELAYYYINKCLRVNFGDLWFSVCDAGRFYSNVVNLPNVCIPFLELYNQKNLLSIDIPNAQPLLLGKFIKCPKYRYDTQSGKFYDNLSRAIFLLKTPHEDFNSLTIKEKNKLREETKIATFRYIFFNNNPLKGGVLFNSMETLYPGVMEQVNIIKSNSKLSQVLQGLESEIIVDGVGMNPDLLVITKHDEVLFIPEMAEYVMAEIQNKLMEYGFKVKLRINPL